MSLLAPQILLESAIPACLWWRYAMATRQGLEYGDSVYSLNVAAQTSQSFVQPFLFYYGLRNAIRCRNNSYVFGTMLGLATGTIAYEVYTSFERIFPPQLRSVSEYDSRQKYSTLVNFLFSSMAAMRFLIK